MRRRVSISGLIALAVLAGATVAHGELSQKGNVRIDYRPVHAFTMTNDIAYIEPKARVY